MRLLGLTGGIGAGKSTSTVLLRQRGFPVVDTDAVAHQLVEPGQPALLEIARQFGNHLLDNSGCLRRAELASLVFADDAARKKLEAILHPRIRESWQAEVARWRANNLPLGIVVIPLLFETDAAGLFFATICVACTTATQHRRLVARGWNDDQIRGRLQAQWSLDRKIAAADFVLWTEADLEVHAEQLTRILAGVGSG